MKRFVTLLLCSSVSLSADFQLFETFESREMVVGNSLVGVNGWDGPDSALATIRDDPSNSGRGNVVELSAESRSSLSRPLGALAIPDGQSGTLFFEVFFADPEQGSNISLGLSPTTNPLSFSDYEAQFRVSGNAIAPRDGGVFVDTGFDVALQDWMQVWVVVDNLNDTLDIYIDALGDSEGQVQVANDLDFRNGSPNNTLQSFFAFQGNERRTFLDNLFIDTDAINLDVPQLPLFRPFEDFEGLDMVIDQTFVNVNGWEGNQPSAVIVAADPLNSGRGQVAKVMSDSTVILSRGLGDLMIANGGSGTLFFELLYTDSDSSPNASFGLSDTGELSGFSNFEAQFRVFGNSFQPRDGGAFVNTGFEPVINEWMQVWLTVDNEDDTVDIYVASPSGSSGRTLVASGLNFRNGEAENALNNFLLIQASERTVYFDNLSVDSFRFNLSSPRTVELPVVAVDDSIEVGIGGSIRFSPLDNDTGPFDSLSLTIISQPTNGSAEIQGSDGAVIYRTTASQPSGDSFRYQVSSIDGNRISEGEVVVDIVSGLNVQNVSSRVPLTPPAVSNGALTVENALPGVTFNGGVAMTSVPGNPRALIVASIRGNVWYVPDTTSANPIKYEVLNVSELSNFTRGRSIYSIECYPDFATSGQIILTYQGDSNRLPMRDGSFDTNVITGLDRNGEPNFNIECDLRISRFTLSPSHIESAMSGGLSEDENNSVLDTEYPYLNLAEQHLFHSINDVKFGPDGYLYVSFGDEGDQGSPYRNDQLLTKDQFGAIIRIDVDPNSTNPLPSPHYAIAVGELENTLPRNQRTHGFYTDPSQQTPNFRIPADNPFLHPSKGGTSGWDGTYNSIDLTGQLDVVRSEIWALGLRNPFKFHLDVEDGTNEVEAWIGDVGKSAREEFSVLKKGENGGWAAWEGSIRTPGLNFTPIEPSGTTPHKPPLYDYAHGSTGNSATGGIFYRESTLASLTNRYICGDYGSGRIWSVGRDGSVTELENLRFGRADVVDFNLDAETGEIFILEHGPAGRVVRLTQEVSEDQEGFPQTLTETGLFASLDDLSPNPGMIPYDVNLTFWSDGADKQRWFLLQNKTDRITYSRDGSWDFPEGMIWVKHFDYNLDQSSPGGDIKRLETRVLVRNEEGSYGVSYRWNDEGTEATLADISGETFPVTFRNALDELETFEWEVPSRAACSTCHTAGAGHGLSFNTRQLNLAAVISGQSGNQISLLDDAGLLEGMTDEVGTLPRHLRPDEVSENLEARVRSYLAVNCAYCHQPDGGAPNSWDAREHLTLEETRMLYGEPLSEATPDLTDHIIRPGDKLNSSIWNKINARDQINGEFQGYSQMPPLASNRFDEEGIELIREWIDNYANTQPVVLGDNPSSLSENTAVGQITEPLDVTDRDVRNSISDQSQLTYAILSGNEDRLFRLDSQTGELTVNGILDFERQSVHNLAIRISDNFSVNPGVTDLALQINLVDELQGDATADLNNNHIFDSFEQEFGLVGANGNDDSTDQDGTALFFEFLSGGNPVVAESESPLGLSIMSADGSPDSVVSWRVRNGLVIDTDYRIRASDDLSFWSDLEMSEYEVIAREDDGPGVTRIWIRIPKEERQREFFRLEEPGD